MNMAENNNNKIKKCIQLINFVSCGLLVVSLLNIIVMCIFVNSTTEYSQKNTITVTLILAALLLVLFSIALFLDAMKIKHVIEISKLLNDKPSQDKNPNQLIIEDYEEPRILKTRPQNQYIIQQNRRIIPNGEEILNEYDEIDAEAVLINRENISPRGVKTYKINNELPEYDEVKNSVLLSKSQESVSPSYHEVRNEYFDDDNTISNRKMFNDSVGRLDKNKQFSLSENSQRTLAKHEVTKKNIEVSSNDVRMNIKRTDENELNDDYDYIKN